MTTTTEKLLDLFENETDDDLVNDVETLKEMGYENDTIEALLIYNLELRLRNRLLENEIKIAENVITHKEEENNLLADKIFELEDDEKEIKNLILFKEMIKKRKGE